MKVSDLQFQNKAFPLSPEKVKQQSPKEIQQNQPGIEGPSFGDVLTEKMDVRFSGHAIKRLEERSMQISPRELDRLNEGVRQLTAKGARNSVVLIDNTAYVVSVKNKTVVTALNEAKNSQNVFTNIDSIAIV